MSILANITQPTDPAELAWMAAHHKTGWKHKPQRPTVSRLTRGRGKEFAAHVQEFR